MARLRRQHERAQCNVTWRTSEKPRPERAGAEQGRNSGVAPAGNANNRRAAAQPKALLGPKLTDKERQGALQHSPVDAGSDK